MAERKYDASSIVSIKNDRDRVRQSPSLYIPSVDADGAIHLIFEAVSNSLDEIGAIGKGEITVIYDRSTYATEVIDNGRGIPHEKLLEAYTVLSTSSKFNNGEDSAYQTSLGIFGHGSKVLNFLSKECTVRSMRDGKYLEYVFKDGILDKTNRGKSKETGTIVKFTIDKSIIAVDELDPKEIQDQLEARSYCFTDIPINFILLDKGKEVLSKTFSGNSLVDLVKRMQPDLDICHAKETKTQVFLKSASDPDLTKEKIEVEAIFSLSEKALDLDTDAMISSYANSMPLYDGGTPVEGLKMGLIKFIKEVMVPKSKKDQEIPIMPSDITAGLCGVVSVKLHKPIFAAQYKSKLTNQEVKFAVRDVVYDYLCGLKAGAANQIMDFVRRVTKGRLASKKVRKKDMDNAFSKDKPDQYRPLVYNMKTVAPQLVLVEGKSAAGLVTSARDPNNQAIYPIQKPKNIYDYDTYTVMHSAAVASVFNDIMDIMGITPGKNCDLSKASIHYLDLLTDGDIDGDSIAVSVVAMVAKHVPEMIDAGMVRRILPPAYSIPNGKKNQYVMSKREFFDILIKKFVKNNTVSIDGKDMTGKQLREFLDLNFDYDGHLQKLADWQCCDPKLMEYIAWKYHGTYQEQKKSYWVTAMKKYPTLSVLVESNMVVIDGDLGSEYVNICFDSSFDERVWKFKKVQVSNSKIFGYSINGEKDKSLYDVMHLFRTYIPKGVTRFKGLGELTASDLAELCMNPETRTVMVFKFGKDREKDIDRMNLVMSSKTKWVAARHDLLSKLSIADADLDT